MFHDGSSPSRVAAFLVGLSYFLAGLVWVGFSDEVGNMLFSSRDAYVRYQNYKGAGFITVSAILIYLLAARRWRPPQPLKGGIGVAPLLAGAVLLTAGPLFALLAFNVMREAEIGLHMAGESVHREAASTASDVLDFFHAQQRLAQVLAQQLQSGPGHGRECSVLLADTLRVQEVLKNIVVFDASRNVLCAARDNGPMAAVPAKALSPNRPLLTSPARFRDRATFALTYPLRDGSNGNGNGGNGGAVQLVLDAARLSPMIRSRLPDDATAALLSGDGELLARWPHLPGVVGTRLAAPFRPNDAGGGEQSVTAPGADGIERYYAIEPVGNTGLYAAAGVSVVGIYAPVRQHALRVGAISLAVLFVAGLLIVGIVRRITAPMNALAEAAAAVAAGGSTTRAPETGPAEIASVAAQFNRMLDRLPALERELRESEERHRTLLDKLSRNVPGMIFQLRIERDGHGWMPFASAAVVGMYEVTAEEARRDARALLRHVHPEDAAAVREATLDSLRRLGHVIAEYRVVLPVGGLRHYLTHAQPERLDDGSLLWYGCTVDVTALEQAQQALRAAKDELEERVAARTRELASANEALENFSSSIAHDLRAPLQAIEGFAGALPAAVGRGDLERAEHLARRIAVNTARTTTMINALLAVARASNVALQERPVRLDAMVRDVVAELQLPPNAVVEVAPLPRVQADPGSLRQVWWNLVANAAKFSARREQPRIEIGWEQGVGELVFFVRDNGAGFDPSFGDRLFISFQRLHDAADFEGNGIGLALVRRIVERHGGRTWAEGQPDQGACFWFSLPASRLLDS